ncbi:thiol:disulfide interchange protein DsbA/DsbL [Luteimonas huabeiensis]|uniref:thiol:disulfide interchange protein DsbA/DsbL n=1 Tax=Luteimonas huabeiensis TaxID=1244513 RepID=UPI0004640687|nr:thiol:disulfide interchange protein DsbA/DsbL [Luteimonas huabeiensis]
MKLQHAFLSLLLAGALAGCGQREEAPAADPTATPPAAEAPAPAADAPQAEAPEAPAPGDAPAPEGDAAAEAAHPPPAPAAPQGPAPVEGTNYVTIQNGQPFQPLDGKIEVVEVFGYTCPGCAAFEPTFRAWKARQPADVRVTALAAPFGGYWMPYARAFYTAESMGLVERTHDKMFEAIHIERSLPVQNVSDQQIANFYAKHGADAAQFASTMQSFAVNAKLKRAEQFIARSGVDSTPTLVVNGKYRVIGGRSYDDVLNTVEHLIARERGAH